MYIECEAERDVRSVNGTNRYEACVEVCTYRSSGTQGELVWKTVCDDMWDHLEATVVCRQLGKPFGDVSS